MKLRRELEQIIASVKKTAKKECDNWDYYKNVISIMDEMIRYIDQKIYDKDRRSSMCGAFGRVLLDNYSFAESKLGQRIFAFILRFQSLEDKE